MPSSPSRRGRKPPQLPGNAYHLLRLLAGVQCVSADKEQSALLQRWKPIRLKELAGELERFFRNLGSPVRPPSYNTLRNLWGLNESVAPSLSTVNSLVEYWAQRSKQPSLQNWEQFVAYVEEYYPWQAFRAEHLSSNVPNPPQSKILIELDPDWVDSVFQGCTRAILSTRTGLNIPEGHFPSRWEIGRRTTGNSVFVGRQRESDMLLNWVQEGNVSVVGIHEMGGMGKTRFVRHFLENRLPERGYLGLDGVWYWSFYGQGTDNQSAAEASFWISLAEFLHMDPPNNAELLQAQFGDKVFEAWKEQKGVLIVLDGLEVLQTDKGILLDDGLYRFLSRVAQAGSPPTSLVVLTSRRPYAELEGLSGYRSLGLKGLMPEEGKQLLLAESALEFEYSAAVQDAEDELLATSRAFAGHPLSLLLFARLLRSFKPVEVFEAGQRVRRGDMRQVAECRSLVESFSVEPSAEWAAGEAGLPFRRLLCYFERELEGESAIAGQVLKALSLIDRPVEPELWQLLRNVLERIADFQPSEAGLFGAFQRLQALGLVQSAGLSHELHPLVRSFFAFRLYQQEPKVFLSLHYFLGRQFVAEFQSSVQARLEFHPLLPAEVELIGRAIYHTTQAEAFELAYHELYGQLLDGQGRNYLTHTLGALRSNRQFLAWMIQPDKANWQALPELSKRSLLQRYSQSLFELGFLDLAFRVQSDLQERFKASGFAPEEQRFWKQQMLQYLRMQVYMDPLHAYEYGKELWATQFAQQDAALKLMLAQQMAFIAHLRGLGQAEVNHWLEASNLAEQQLFESGESQGNPYFQLEDWFWAQLLTLEYQSLDDSLFDTYILLHERWGSSQQAIIYAAEAMAYVKLGDAEGAKDAVLAFFEALPQFQHTVLEVHALLVLTEAYSGLVGSTSSKEDKQLLLSLQSKLERGYRRCVVPALMVRLEGLL